MWPERYRFLEGRVPGWHNEPMPSTTEAQRASKRESNRRYYAAHPEKRREEARRYYATHREKQREYIRRWKAANPDKVREYRRRYRAAQKAERRAAPTTRQPVQPVKVVRWETPNAQGIEVHHAGGVVAEFTVTHLRADYRPIDHRPEQLRAEAEALLGFLR